MQKRTKRTLQVAGSIVALILLGKYEGCFYVAPLNNFTLSDVCKLEKGMKFVEARKTLRYPGEYHTYNFSTVFSTQFVSGPLFIEIMHNPDNEKVEEIFLGKGRTKTLQQSGACRAK